MSSPWSCLLVLAGELGAGLLVGVLAWTGADISLAEVPRLADPAAQLLHARAAKSSIWGEEGDSRVEARERAIEAYRAVRRFWPEAGEECAEAAFRAAELLRAAGDMEASLVEFGVAFGRGRGTEFRARAQLEQGHVLRRQGEMMGALEHYTAVAHDASARRALRETAELWSGRAARELGRGGEARRTWLRVARNAQDPVLRVRAWDWTAIELIEIGELEGAAAVLQRAREGLADQALEESRQGERTRNALERMRALNKLRSAVEARHLASRKGAAGTTGP